MIMELFFVLSQLSHLKCEKKNSSFFVTVFFFVNFGLRTVGLHYVVDREGGWDAKAD